MIVCEKPTPGLLDMPGVTSEQVGSTEFYGLTRPGRSVSLFPPRIFVVQNCLDHERPNRKFLEGDKVPGQDRIQLVDAVRHGNKLFQLLSPFFPCLHYCCQFHALGLYQVAMSLLAGRQVLGPLLEQLQPAQHQGILKFLRPA